MMPKGFRIQALRSYIDAMLIYVHKSIKIQPSAIGYIAKSVTLVGKGEKHKAYRACDIAPEYFYPSRVRVLLLIKVCNPYSCTSATHIT